MDLDISQLGKKSAYIANYDNTLLFPIPRINKREEIGLKEYLPFTGVDIWNHYEVSWLNLNGKPQIAICRITYPCESPNIIESKSMKLYFNSFNNTKFTSIDEVKQIITQDISNNVNYSVAVELNYLNKSNLNLKQGFQGINLDSLDIVCETYMPKPEYLMTTDNIVHEILYSDLLKSNCLVTNQPDWGSIQIEYKGRQINHENLLKYIISLRNHNEFHEQCIERIFNDIWKICTPSELTIYARYTRRGGLDINPYRSSKKELPENIRLIRQ